MQRTRCLYTYTLSAIGAFCLVSSIFLFNRSQIDFIFIMTLITVLLSLFPTQLPSGNRWSTSSISILFLFLQAGYFSSIIAIGCSTLAYFYRRKLNFSYENCLHFFSIAGSYCAGLAAANLFILIPFPNHWHVFIHASISLVIFELMSLSFIKELPNPRQNPDHSSYSFKSFRFEYSVFTLILVASMILAQLTLHVHDQFFFPVLVGSVTILASFVVLSREYVKAENARHQSEAKYQLIATHTSDLILILRPDGMIDYASPSVSNISSDISSQQLINRSVFDCVDFVEPSLPMEIFNRACKDKSIHRIDLQIRVDNKIYDFDTQVSPVHSKTGELTMLVVVARDITERKRNEEQINRTEKLAIAGELAAGVAHEIRNPLTSLKGFLQLSKDNLSDKIGTFSIMWNELTQIERIVSELLLLAKPQSSQRVTMDVAEIMESVIMLMKGQAHEQNIHITFTAKKYLPHIAGDGNKIRQLFINLIKNSVESMSVGGTIFIDIGLLDGEQILIKIRDEGTGIPADRMNRLGEPFYTTKEKGTGLGLMVSYNIVRDHHGTLTFISQPNMGTIAEIKLPLFELADEPQLTAPRN